MATWDDVRTAVLRLPQTEERADGTLEWRVADKLLLWERPLRSSDLRALGDDAPRGDILGARVPDEGVKHALIAERPDVYFTTPHFDGYPAVLARLDGLSAADLDELATEAWLDRAPKRLVRSYLDEHPELATRQ